MSLAPRFALHVGLLLSVAAWWGCSSNSSVSKIPGQSPPEVAGSGELVVPVEVPINKHPEYEALGTIVEQAGGKLRLFELPENAKADDVVVYSLNPDGRRAVGVAVDFRDVKITDATFAQVAADPIFRDVTSIDVSGTGITDDSLANIAKAERLTYVSILNTAVTDKGLEYLHGHKYLSLIFLERFVDGHGISLEGEKKLIRSLPNYGK